MISVVDLGGRTTRVQASLAGQDVVVLAFVCPSRRVAAGVLDMLDRQIARRAALNEPPAEPDDQDSFGPGTRVSVSVYDWDAGSRRIDATVSRRISPELLELRTRFGQVMKNVEQIRVRLGWSAH